MSIKFPYFYLSLKSIGTCLLPREYTGNKERVYRIVIYIKSDKQYKAYAYNALRFVKVFPSPRSSS